MINPFYFAGVDAYDRDARARLRIADFRPAAYVFGVRGLGNIVGHDSVLRSLTGINYGCDYGFLIGRKLKIHRRLSSGKLEWFARVITFTFLFVLLALLRAALDHVQEVAFFFLEVLLAVGALLLSGRIALAPLAAALTLAPPKSAAARDRWSWRSAASGYLCHLYQRAGFERHHIQIVCSREVDVLLIAREVSVGFAVGGVGYSPSLVRRIVIDEKITLVHEEGELLIL